jgi:chemotaxis protein MotB
MARKKIHFAEENENWLITYADTITNLLAFFVLIVSVSTIDQTAWSAVNNSVKEKLNQKEKRRQEYERLKKEFEDTP